MKISSLPKGKIESFTDLVAWQEGHKLVLMIYKATKNFPSDEKFGLVNQLRRAGVSITSNIAEGFRKATPGEKIQAYSHANGSLSEVQNQLLISKDVHYLSTNVFRKMADQSVIVSKLLTGLLKRTKTMKK